MIPVRFWARPQKKCRKMVFLHFFATIFTPMKFLLHKILVLIIGVCFLSAYFEFNDAEKNQNYENETHTYISAEKQTSNFSIKKLDKNPIVFFKFETVISRHFFEKQTAKVYPLFPIITQQLFLRHSVFLIWFYALLFGVLI